jgi:uncharacterized protein YktA (UPF0223 family)
MAKIKITFHKCIQDSQEYGSDDEHMVSRIFFSIEVTKEQDSEVEVEEYDDLYADIKQVIGGKFERSPIEVSFPYLSSGEPYSGVTDYQAFRNAAEDYFRGLVGTKASGIHIEGVSNIRMSNNLLMKEHSVDFEASDARSSLRKLNSTGISKVRMPGFPSCHSSI